MPTSPALPLSALRGLGPSRLETLRQAGITSVRDLLMTLPARYKDTLEPTPISQLRAGQTACVCGCLDAAPKLSRFKGRTLVSARLHDGSGAIRLQWFNQPWLAKQLSPEGELLLCGTVADYRGSLQLVSPSVEHERGLLPVYRALPGLKSGVMAGLIGQALGRLEDCVTETLPAATRERQQLCKINFALRELHRSCS